MNNFQPSKYQQTIFDFIERGSGNAVINAVAGSGKTTTIIQALNLIPQDQQIYFLAFNKSIVEELKTKVPAYVNVMTLHSLGAKSLWNSQRSKLNDKKSSLFLDSFKRVWFDADYDYLQRVKKLIDLYRINLCDSVSGLLDLAEKHNIELTNGECERAIQVVNAMNADRTQHDFTDMLYLPAVDPSIKLPKADWVFVDECQDMNPAQQMLLTKLLEKPTARFVAVGDPHQAIYGFAGADAESFNNLKSRVNTIELPLSVNYRCGKNIIDIAKSIVPHLEAHEGAADGEFDDEASFKSISDGDMVLCRNVAPLVSLCLKNITEGRKAYVKGGDIGRNLINLVERSKAISINDLDIYLAAQLMVIEKRLGKRFPFLSVNEIWEESSYVSMKEKITVLETIVDSQNIQDPRILISWIESLFADEKAGICFSSIHKSKGLENARVFIIEPKLMPSKYAKKAWQKEQETNLIYVAYTRAKQYLGIVTDWEFYKSKKNF